MKRRHHHWIPAVSAVTAALIGLIVLQIHLLMESYAQKEQAFDRNVMNALTAVSQQIEKQEAARGIFTVALTADAKASGKQSVLRKMPKPKNRNSISYSWVFADTMVSDSGKQMKVEVFHSAGVDTLSSIVIRSTNDHSASSSGYRYSVDSAGMKFDFGTSDSLRVILRDTTRQRKVELVSKVVDKLFLFESMPIERRLQPAVVDSMIGASLRSVGISIPFQFRITSGMHDTVRLSSDTAGGVNMDSPPYTAPLFPNDVLSQHYRLSVYLPEKSSFVLGEMAGLVGLSFGFIAIIIASFLVTVRSMVRQQRFSSSVVAFINNMTHEFKTPISTIALAAEAILKPEILKSRPKLRTYTSLIAEENARMKQQVDTILQMAVLERGEFEVKMETVDIHTIIANAVRNVALIVEQRNGAIRTELHAKEARVRGDQHHLSNVIRNLLDNAIKYSPARPEIDIATETGPDGVHIRISDRGIGIASAEIDRVFEPYFRVSRGNTHDVKGFGLGLSYVKLIVEAHHGTISLRSEVGKGTVVEVMLPT